MEIELKFQIPAASRAALRRAVQTASARGVRLAAVYVDTADRRLAGAGIAARLRREDGRWVQTVKVSAGDALLRLEHEVVLPPRRGTPRFDAALHAGSPVEQPLAAALGGDAAALQAVFTTDVQRVVRVLRSGGAAVELALDVGTISAGGQRLALHEIEFELKSGSVAALLALAARWVQRHRLWLDVRSKAERGMLLAVGDSASAPTLALAPSLPPHASRDAALRAMVASCLAHALPNASALAGGAGGAEHLHQLRVALRRLRSVLRLWSDGVPAVDPAWADAAAALFAALGAARDDDALRDSVLPALREAGAPAFEWPQSASADAPSPAALLQGLDANRLWLALLGYAHGAAEPPADDAPLLQALAPALVRLQRQLRRDARRFAAAPIDERHRTRKRVKRLRYGAEALSSLLPAKQWRRFVGGLRPVQEALGDYNDLLTAEALLAREGPAGPGHWFSRGWLAASRERAEAEAAQALRGLPALPRALRRAG